MREGGSEGEGKGDLVGGGERRRVERLQRWTEVGVGGEELGRGVE